jgi:hypothetical protein
LTCAGTKASWALPRFGFQNGLAPQAIGELRSRPDLDYCLSTLSTVIDTGVPRAAITCDSAKATFLAGERAVDQEQQAFARKLRRPQGSSSAFLEQLFRQRPSCRLGLALSPSRVAWNESGGAHRVFKFPPRLRVTYPPPGTSAWWRQRRESSPTRPRRGGSWCARRTWAPSTSRAGTRTEPRSKPSTSASQ